MSSGKHENAIETNSFLTCYLVNWTNTCLDIPPGKPLLIIIVKTFIFVEADWSAMKNIMQSLII